MLNELLRHIKCERLEAERAKAARPTVSSCEQHGGEGMHGGQRKSLRVECREESSSKILKQLNAILETRDTAHGFVVVLGDDLFENFRLRSASYERLRRITRFSLSHPGVRIGAEVHTKSTGLLEHDQWVSAERVFELVKYFVTNGVHDLCVSAIGLVKTDENQGQSTGNRRRAQRFELSGESSEIRARAAAAAA
jgi:outer membrane protein OmpA-like peptidoglycan-associated protein